MAPDADGYDQRADDDRDETLCAELEAESTIDGNSADTGCAENPAPKYILLLVKDYTTQMGDTTEHMNRFWSCQYDSNILSKFPVCLKIAFPESLKIAHTELENAIDTELLGNQLDVMQGEFGELNQFKCSGAAHRCRVPGPTGPDEDKRELMMPTNTLYIITLDLVKKTRNNAIGENIGHSESEIDRAD